MEIKKDGKLYAIVEIDADSLGSGKKASRGPGYGELFVLAVLLVLANHFGGWRLDERIGSLFGHGPEIEVRDGR